AVAVRALHGRHVYTFGERFMEPRVGPRGDAPRGDAPRDAPRRDDTSSTPPHGDPLRDQHARESEPASRHGVQLDAHGEPDHATRESDADAPSTPRTGARPGETP